MAMSNPEIVSTRDDRSARATQIARALLLAREIESLLHDAEVPSTPSPNGPSSLTHSPRIALAICSSLVDELAMLQRREA